MPQPEQKALIPLASVSSPGLRQGLEDLCSDVAHGLRQLRKSPTFTLAAILTLALGIGANTAIFTLVNAVLLRSLPVADPSQLYSLGTEEQCCTTGSLSGEVSLYSYPLYREIRDHTRGFVQLAAFLASPMTLGVRPAGSTGAALPHHVEFVSGNYFATYGIGGVVGRAITPADDRQGAPPVAVLSYQAWRDRYGLEQSVLGSSVWVSGVPTTIVGIAPPAFFGDTLQSDPPELWLPISFEPLLRQSGTRLERPDIFWLNVVGRVERNVQVAPLQDRLRDEIKQWAAAQSWMRPDDRRLIPGLHVTVTRAGAGVQRMSADYGDGLRLLSVVSALLLLIACANIANLILARGMASRLQTAVRLALGARRGRIMRQTITEGLLLALLGGAAGLAVAFAGTHLILALAFRGARFVPIEATPSWPVLGFTAFVCVLTGVLFSVGPAIIASRTHPAEPMRGAGRSTRDRQALPQRALVVAQAALSLVLLATAGLLSGSLRALEAQHFGFTTDGRMIAQVDLGLSGGDPARLEAVYQELERRLRELPGVESASYALYSPMERNNWSLPMAYRGRMTEFGKSPQFDRASAHYFETIGTRVLRGRAIDDRDRRLSQRVAVINEQFARTYFPRQDPLGQHVGMLELSHDQDYEIVGVVEDAKYDDPRGPAPAGVFLPFLQDRDYSSHLGAFFARSNYLQGIQLRVHGRPPDLEPKLRQLLSELAPGATLIHLVPFDELVARNFNGDRLVAGLTSLYGGLALILACIGLYGVSSYAVVRRSREIGLRMALGANRGGVIAMVLRSSLRPIALGLLIGIPVALAAGRAIRSQLFGVSSYDPLVLVGAAACLVVSAVCAAFFPARRSASIDPMEALRAE
jgi:predicted permease